MEKGNIQKNFFTLKIIPYKETEIKDFTSFLKNHSQFLNEY